MIVKEFRFMSINDEFDLKNYNDGNAWSRVYEYKLAEDFLKNNFDKDIEVHNSAWGFEGIHITFRENIDKVSHCVHSDIVGNKFGLETYPYNLLKTDETLIDRFDCVLNISVLEHLGSFEKTRTAILNLFEQVKEGGYLFCTFDYPRVNLKELELMLGHKCLEVDVRLNGANSKVKNNRYKNLNVIVLILQKEGGDV